MTPASLNCVSGFSFVLSLFFWFHDLCLALDSVLLDSESVLLLVGLLPWISGPLLMSLD